jgi:hypothetical protein
MLTRSAAEDARRLFSASVLKILAQSEGLCEAWSLQDDLKRFAELPHGSQIRNEQFCSE